METGDEKARDPRDSGAGAVANIYLGKSISHLTLALEALELAEIPLACGYVDLALTICLEERARRGDEGGHLGT